MAKKEKTIPFRIFVKDTSTNETFNWDDLTEDKEAEFKARMSLNLSDRMSRYYSEHPEQYEKLIVS